MKALTWMMIQITEVCARKQNRETERLITLGLVWWRGRVSALSGLVADEFLTLSKAAPKGSQACRGGLCWGRRSEKKAAFFALVALFGLLKDRSVQRYLFRN